jgi:filamentous hemagglutinin family protein
MNRAYRLIWSEARQAYVAVAEVARARGKRSAAALALCAAFLAVPPAPTFAANLPEGGHIVAGSGSIAQSGNTMTVTQSSAKLAANWQSFSIGQGYAVEFAQPSATAVALNRVLGSDVSVIQGALRANGQVFLINPNGVLFTPTAQVEVGGLIASTLNLSNEDFLAGRYRFAGDSSNSVINQGSLKTAAGGTVALVAARIENTGRIEAPQGSVLMGAGNQVTLDLGGPVKIQVEEGALNALIQQGGAIKADGGLVYLTAKAANDLASAAINHTGITEARRLATGEKGEIWLMGDMAHGQVNVAGTLDASAPAGMRGGFIETSAAKVKVQEGASIRAGHWLIDPNDFTIAASGGDITGATLSASLASGDVTIQSSSGGTSGNGDIFVRDDVTWSSGNTLTLSAHRNIEILATLDASAGSGGKVALEYGQGAPASGNTATYSFGLTGTGFTGRINLQAGPNFTTKLGSDGTVDNWTVITSLGSGGDETSGAANSLQGLAHSSMLSGNYVLGADIDASATSTWNSNGSGGYYGFLPIGKGVGAFTGRFDGLGHVISNLTIDRPATDGVGLFGYASGGDIRNVGLANGSVSGSSVVGGLVGTNYDTISNSYATGSVEGSGTVGGLVGGNGGTVSDSYATGAVSGSGYTVGGLVGFNYGGTISNSYASGSVSGSSTIGGLVGYNFGGTISNSYATGAVSGSSAVGGLVGYNDGAVSQSYATGSVSGTDQFVGGLVGWNGYGTVTDSFWDTQTSGRTTSAGGSGAVGKTTAQMKSLATYTAAGWDIDDAGGTGKVWRIYDGQSYPLLRSFLTPLTATANSGSRVYDGTTSSPFGVSYSTTPNSNLLGTPTVTASSKDVGSRALTVSGLYSNQAGYDISYVTGTLTITPKTLSITGTTVANKTYDGTTAASVSAGTLSGFVGSETVSVASASGAFDNKNAGAGKTVTVAYTLSDGTNGGLAANYTLAGTTHTADITPKSLTASYSAASKVYDGTTAATVSATSGDIVTGDAVTIAASGTFADKNAGVGKTVSISGGALSGADAGNYALANPPAARPPTSRRRRSPSPASRQPTRSMTARRAPPSPTATATSPVLSPEMSSPPAAPSPTRTWATARP